MITQTTIPALSVTKSADEWRAILVDPQMFLNEVRDALAAQRASDDTRRGNITIGSNPAPVNAAKIKRAAETQNKKVAKRFLAPDTGPHTCQFCDKTFDAQKYLNIHIGRMHKGETTAQFPNIAQTADDASVA